MLHKNYKKRTCVKNLVHNPHGQFSGFQSFIFNSISSSCYFFGTISQILGPKKVKVSVPLYTILTLFLLNPVFFLSHNNDVHFSQIFRS